MRHVTPRLVCDICEVEHEIEEPATRVIVLSDDGHVWALDLCIVHDEHTRPTQLEEVAKVYGSILKPYVTRKGRLATVSNRRSSHRPHHVRSRRFHDPGGPSSGEYDGPMTCLVPIDDGRPCAQTTRNVIGLKKHQWSAHGITVKRG